MSIHPETEHLAGCPWCDVAPVVTESDGPWFVGCANPDCPLQCEVRGDTRAEAERLWNVRPEEQRLRAQRDAERAENARLRAAIEAHRDALKGIPKEAQFGADERLWAALKGGENG